MSSTEIPNDVEQRNIIDKLANFVARNGPEFEEMTKSKQRGNDKFAFLFGGPHHEYYNRRVADERTNMNSQQQLSQLPPPTRHHLPPPAPSSVHQSIQSAPWQQQQQQQQQQPSLRHSSTNYQSLPSGGFPPAQQSAGVFLSVAPSVHMVIDVNEFSDTVQPVIETCSKESVSNGKNWIFDHAVSVEHCQHIAHLLFNRAIAPSIPFIHRLNLIYLINDCLHHCVRKNANDLLKALEQIIPSIFDVAFRSSETMEQKQKLDKVVGLWESNNYFCQQLIEQLKQSSTFQSGSGMQHTDQSVGCGASNLIPPLMSGPPQSLPATVSQSSQLQYAQQFHSHPTFSQPPVNQTATQLSRPPAHFQPPPNFMQQPPPPHTSVPPGSGQMLPANLTVPGVNLPNMLPQENAQLPAKYYDLPAGLIAPLVKIDDPEYKAIDPAEIKLPHPQPPSEELLNALEEFYSFESQDTTKDSEGWDMDAVLSFLKTRQKRHKQLKERRRSRSRSKSASRSRSRSPRRRRHRRRSRSRSRSPRFDRRRSRSHSRSPRRRRSRSRSCSPRRSPRDRERRSITPPMILFQSMRREDSINEDNVGHQLLKKMGWGGSGLGANEQGIQEPIREGDVRDKVDQYKGVGVPLNDLFEVYRKNKSYTYNRKPRGSER